MNEKTSALHSTYIIDGIPQELTPAQMLDACMAGRMQTPQPEVVESIVDESLDPPVKPLKDDGDASEALLPQVAKAASEPRMCPLAYPECFTKETIASALDDVIWRDGRFTLQDLELKLRWKWDCSKVGSMAAFYASAAAAADYIDGLGLRIAGYTFEGSTEGCFLEAEAVLGTGTGFTDPELEEDDGETSILESRRIPDTLRDNAADRLLYIPFDNCDFRLGGSLLSRVCGAYSEIAPQIIDADYFIDCYEVVRELVEDGIAVAGTSVGRGGLLTALHRMAREGVGICADLSDLMKAYGEKGLARLMYSEIPGVLVQVADFDYDYVDAELLLQDVAYFPLGSPCRGDVQISATDKSGIRNILESLIRSQSSEGED